MNNLYDLLKIKIKSVYSYIRTSLWVLPSIILLFFFILAIMLIEFDREHPAQFNNIFIFGIGEEGAMTVLTTIASSMITIAGVVFSITVVALSLSSTQYSSRVLRNFMSNHKNQISLGIFVGIFIYSLIVMLQINVNNDKYFPFISVATGIFFSFLGIGDFIFFIHHIATSIQASQIVSNIYSETIKVIDYLYPDELHEDEELEKKEKEEVLDKTKFFPVPVLTTGYIQKVDEISLIHFAESEGIIINMIQPVGSFVIADQTLVGVSRFDISMVKKINKLFIIGRNRTIEQDAEFGIRQTVDVAIKALSPGINDTTTAVMCIERLAGMMARIVNRKMKTFLYRKNNNLRLIGYGNTFEFFMDEAFNQIRHNSRGDALILLKLSWAYKIIYDEAKHYERKKIIAKHIKLLKDIIDIEVKLNNDKQLLHQKCEWLKD